ncbi:MAG: hypothetical protein C0402_11265 [Thermodesulfovibrio sp.]|nr:hypothetical protein [Thermodesulfovibrio sp.]
MSIQPPAMNVRNSISMDPQHAEEILHQIKGRNSGIEQDPLWIQRAYQKPMFKNLHQVPEREYAEFSKYLANGSVYIIVHPAYYTFFHDSELFPDNLTGATTQNAMDRFLSATAFSGKAKLMKAQEKVLRDFLEYVSTEKKLVIMILPKGYKDFSAYKFRDAQNEYLRFLNEVTNESDSVLYLYSRKPSRGMLSVKDRKLLLKFLYAVRPKEILLGGGYVGRCLDDFYRDLEQHYGEEKLFIVPEIAAVSPADMSEKMSSDVITREGLIDIRKLALNVRENLRTRDNAAVKTRNLSNTPDNQ